VAEQIFNPARFATISEVATGVVVLVFARQTTFVAGLVTFFFIALPVTVLNTSLTPLLLSSTPREYLGRMIAVFNPINQAASMISILIAGWLASTALLHFHANVVGLHIGRIDTIFTVAGVLVVGAGIYAAFAFPPNQPSEPSEPPAPVAGIEEARAHDASPEVIEIGPTAVPPRQPTEPLIEPTAP
jgi:fucose permease